MVHDEIEKIKEVKSIAPILLQKKISDGKVLYTAADIPENAANV